MRVLHFVSKFAGGGLERRSIQAIKGISTHPNIEQLIVVFSDVIEYREVLSLNVEIKYVLNKNKLSRIKAVNTIIKGFHPDIVHSWLDLFPTEHFLISALKVLYKYKYIHGAVCNANRMKPFTMTWASTWFSFIFSDAIVSNSRAGLLAKNAPQSKSHVIYNGFNFARIPRDLDEAKIREIGGNADIFVTMCARVDKSKDWASFIKIAKRISKSYPDVFFLAIGNGNLLDYYREQVREEQLNNICFVGRRNDVEELFGLSDICMLLTVKERSAEGVSNSVMESMAVGKPVIATRCGGTPEIISDGIDGFIVDNNYEDAFRCLKELLDKPELRNEMGKKGKEKIAREFSLDMMTKNYMALYNTILRG